MDSASTIGKRKQSCVGGADSLTSPSAYPRVPPARVSTYPLDMSILRTLEFHVSATNACLPSGDTVSPAG
eukprot:1163235-Prorocentrum_minimum.AAC.4